MEDIKYVKCPVCGGNPRRYLSYTECMRNCVFYGSYEDCTNCKDGYVVADNQEDEIPDWCPLEDASQSVNAADEDNKEGNKI